MRNVMVRALPVVGGALMVGQAHAAALTFDTTDVVGSIGAGGTAAAAVGVAALLFSIGIKVYRRLRGAA